MHLNTGLSLASVLVLPAVAACTNTTSPTSCDVSTLSNLVPTLESSLRSNATVLSAVHVNTNGSFGDPVSDSGLPPWYSTGLPDLCAVEVNVTSSGNSSYIFWLFLPSAWNSKFMAVGNAGAGGFINFLDMGAGTHYGFATLSTNTGHTASIGDVSWAYGEPEKWEDFGWRSMHGSVELGKDLVAAYYKQSIKYSYYTGCSTGGRQGLKEAQVQFDSFDGMLIGAPAWWSSHFVSWATKISKDFYTDEYPTGIIPTDLFPTLAATIVEQCDALDGVEDGIISAADLCKPDLSVLACNATTNSSSCFTPLQIEMLGEIYSNYTVNSTFVYPGLEPSSELGWSTSLFGGIPNPSGLDFMRAMLSDPDWALEDYDDSVLEYVTANDPGNSSADDYDMSSYRDRGGKILMYHGLADPLIPTGGSVYFYEQVAAATGISHPITDWFRLFFVPGMLHCTGTPVGAPWMLNGIDQTPSLSSSAYSIPGFEDARHDAILALMDWVENGNAVDEIIATNYNDLTDFSKGVSIQRPLCPYPQRAVYDGIGDVDESDSWSCKS
ncbi:putative Carboxylic ester hydrolase [Seiridium cardinale]